VEEFDGDFRRHLFQRTLHHFGSVCQPVGVDVYPDPATPSAHVIAELQAADRLLEFVPTFWTLESDHMCVGAGHLHYSSHCCRHWECKRDADGWAIPDTDGLNVAVPFERPQLAAIGCEWLRMVANG
jgi:hypothetical protein